jgi:hypothetical protein
MFTVEKHALPVDEAAAPRKRKTKQVFVKHHPRLRLFIQPDRDPLLRDVALRVGRFDRRAHHRPAIHLQPKFRWRGLRFSFTTRPGLLLPEHRHRQGDEN